MDVDYRDGGAVAAGLWFRGWEAVSPEHEAVAAFSVAVDYEPGKFLRRELPCLLGVLQRGPRPDVMIVDGYVWLTNNEPGLGAYLHAVVGGDVVGVAKTRFTGATSAVAIFRGGSKSPLFVSAIGMSAQEAAAKVAAMHGPHRLPTLLKQVDVLARKGGQSC